METERAKRLADFVSRRTLPWALGVKRGHKLSLPDG